MQTPKILDNLLRRILVEARYLENSNTAIARHCHRGEDDQRSLKTKATPLSRVRTINGDLDRAENWAAKSVDDIALRAATCRNAVDGDEPVVRSDARAISGPTGCHLSDPKLLTGKLEGYADPPEPVAGGALIASGFGRSVSGEAVECAGNPVEQSLVDLVFRKRPNGRRHRLGVLDKAAHQRATGVRLVIGWHRIDGHLSAAVAECDLRFVFRAGALCDGEFAVEPGQTRRAGEDQLSV